MPKKATKKAKGRLDKFWKQAHEQGYRARSAFKLEQLNRKYGFLAKSNTLVDLCAAPGGWCQVAAKHMPVGSTIVGVDLFAIKHINGVKTIVGDIFKEKTRKEILQALNKKKAEVVLHDGSPTVGGTWDKDAYVQNCLVLAAAKIGCEVLAPKGTFVTKVFRSADYTKLLFVLNQLFEKVTATKPPSSRNTSAEIFVVCQGFKCPKKIDPSLFNPTEVFAELKAGVEDANKSHFQLLRELDPKRQARNAKHEGYDLSIGGFAMYKRVTVGEFVRLAQPEVVLRDANEMSFAECDDIFRDSVHTTAEHQELIKDLKLLGKSDQTKLLKWREKLVEEDRKRRREGMGEDDAEELEGGDEYAEEESEDEDKKLERLQNEVDDFTKKREKDKKKRMKKTIDKKLKLAQVTNFNPEDAPNMNFVVDVDDVFEDDTVAQLEHLTQSAYDTFAANADSKEYQGGEGSVCSDVDEDETGEYKDDQYDADGVLVSKKNDDDFDFRYDDSDDDDAEKDDEEDVQMKDSDEEYSSSEDDFDNDQPPKKKQKGVEDGKVSKSALKHGFEEVPMILQDPESRARTLAIATKMLDKKNRRDILESSINRYTFNDEEGDLPEWFVDDEKKHNFIHLPVTKAEMDAQRQRFKELNARPVKKVLEAINRKRVKAKKLQTKIWDKVKDEGGTSSQQRKSVPTVRKIMRSKRFKNSHKKKGPRDTKSLGESRRSYEKLKRDQKGSKKRKR